MKECLLSSLPACACSPLGTLGGETTCSQVTGQCPCLPNVAGRDCGACEPGFFDLRSGAGCKRSVLGQVFASENKGWRTE